MEPEYEFRAQNRRFKMEPEVIDYPANGTLEDLSRTCGGDEDGFRGPLVKLVRVEDAAGNKGIRATYQPIPLNQPYVSKDLFFFNITTMTAAQKQDLTV